MPQAASSAVNAEPVVDTLPDVLREQTPGPKFANPENFINRRAELARARGRQNARQRFQRGEISPPGFGTRCGKHGHVGHEPDFTRVIRALTGAVVVLAKSGVAVVELEESCTKGKLGWLFPRASRSIVDDTQAAVANGGRFGVIPGVYDAHGSRHGMKLPVLPHASSFGRTFLESEPPLSCISFPTRKV
jgi:hypothetical protein